MIEYRSGARSIQYKTIAPPEKKRRTERGDLLDYFLSVLNPGRIKEGFKPVDHGFLNWKLKGVPTRDLYALQSKMEDSRRLGFNPSKTFWFELKAKV